MPTTQDASVKKTSSRPKPRLSCSTCRARKLKCDRKQPCGNCAKDSRNDCSYLPNGGLSNEHRSFRQPSRACNQLAILKQSLEQALLTLTRIQREGNVGHEVQQGRDHPAPGTSQGLYLDQQDCSEGSIGRSQLDKLLDQIDSIGLEASKLRASPLESPSPLYSRRNFDGLQLLFCEQNNVRADELHQFLVNRPVTEVLFNTLVTDAHTRWTLLLIHWPTFKQELDMFWLNPGSADLSWLAVLYALLSIASHAVSRSKIRIEGLSDSDRMSRLYMERAAQCLRASDYTKPSIYTVSAMILYLACEHNWAKDRHFDASLVLSLTFRVALKMGYHRDPSSDDNMTVFQGEMRRRIWTFLKQLDHLIAQKCGLPRLIDDRKTDTGLPQNIRDTDLHPNMQALPQSYLNDIFTPIGVLNYKDGLLAIHGRIMDIGHEIQLMPYEYILQLHQQLVQKVNSKPSWLEVDFARKCGLDDVEQLNVQVEIDLIIQGAFMALHNNYLVIERKDPNFELSRATCLYAARRSLHLQHLLFDVSDLHADGLKTNWRLISLMGHDFLFAALLLCLHLEHSTLKNKHSTLNQHKLSSVEDRDENLHLLRTAQQDWSRFGRYHDSGKEAAMTLHMLVTNLTTCPEAVPEEGQWRGSDRTRSTTLARSSDNTNVSVQANNWPSPLQQDTAPNVQASTSFNMGSSLHRQIDASDNCVSWPEKLTGNSSEQIQNMFQNYQLNFDWNAWNASMSDIWFDTEFGSMQWI